MGGIILTTTELKYFLAVYASHSIKKAAQSLYITSQALSKTIKRIEMELDVTLFTRTHEGLLPTHAADQLAKHAHIIINELDNIQSDFSLADANNSIVLTIPTTYGVLDYLHYDFIRQFYIEYPYIKLNLIELPETQIHELLGSNTVELAFLPAPIDFSAYEAHYCFAWKHCTIINRKHPLASKKTIQYTDLDGIPLALRGRSYSVYPTNISRFLKEGVHVNVLLETTSETLIHEFAQTNAGIGISLTFLAQKQRTANTVIREFEDPNCQKEVYIVKNKDTTVSNEANCFIAYLNNWLTTC